MIAALIIGIVPVLWVLLRLVTPSMNFEMDFDQAHGTFFSIFTALQRPIWSIFWAGIIGSVAYQHFIGHGDASQLLMAAGVYALLLNTWLLMTYERYLHQRYPRAGGTGGASNYTPAKYCLSMALAGATVFLFVMGLATALIGMGA